MNEELHNRIEAFLAGGLSSAERKAFLAEVANDSQLAEVVAQRRLECEMVRQRPDFIELIRRADAKVDVQPTGSPKEEVINVMNDEGAAAGARRGRISKPGLLLLPLLIVSCLLLWYWSDRKVKVEPPFPTLVDPSAPTPSDAPAGNEAPKLNPTDEAPERTPIPPMNPTPSTSPAVTPPPIAAAGKAQKYQQLAFNLYEPYEPINLRGSADQPDVADSMGLAKAAYVAGDWAEVLRSSPTGSSAALKLKAHAAFQGGEFSLAADLFRQLEQRDLFYQETAQWFQLLSLAAAEQADSAAFRTLLAKVTASGHRYAEDAQGFSD